VSRHHIHQANVLIFTTISLYGSTALTVLGPLFQFLDLYTVGKTPWMGVSHIARPLPTNGTTQIHNKYKQISMPRVGFEPTITVFERTKAVHALDRAANVIGHIHNSGKLKSHTDYVLYKRVP
jgi:hypothetical protein